jgi:hypothetical protein
VHEGVSKQEKAMTMESEKREEKTERERDKVGEDDKIEVNE